MQRDVVNEKVSIDGDCGYGVVIDGATVDVDLEPTEALRRALRERRA